MSLSQQDLRVQLQIEQLELLQKHEEETLRLELEVRSDALRLGREQKYELQEWQLRNSNRFEKSTEQDEVLPKTRNADWTEEELEDCHNTINILTVMEREANNERSDAPKIAAEVVQAVTTDTKRVIRKALKQKGLEIQKQPAVGFKRVGSIDEGPWVKFYKKSRSHMHKTPDAGGPLVRANMGEGDGSPMEKMGQLTTKAFCDGLLATLYPHVYNHSTELFKWIRGMAKQATSLTKELEYLQAKGKRDEDELEQLRKEGADSEEIKKGLANKVLLERTIATKAVKERDRFKKSYEEEKLDAANSAVIIQNLRDVLKQRATLLSQRDEEIKVLNISNQEFKNLNDDLEKELVALTDERDDALQDAWNANDKEERLIERIKELEDELGIE
ncbi:unnamed protein product [Calypogeia fissa]